MDLALTVPSSRNPSSYGEPDRNSVSGFDPGVQFRETRSSYFLDVNVPGLRKEDIWLQMDNTRALLIRGQRYVEGVGMVGWTWHLIQRGSSRRRPFRVPNDVHVAAVSANFHQGALHVVMPKFRWNRFSPYQLNYRSNCNLQLQLYPPMAPPMLEPPTHRPKIEEETGEAGESGEFLCEEIICEGAADEEEKLLEIRLEMETIEEIEEISTSETQDRSSEQPQRVLVEELIEEKEKELGVSPCGDHEFESPGSDSKAEVRKDIAAEEVMNESGCEASTVSTDVDEKKGSRSDEERRDRECDHGNAKTEITMDSGGDDGGKVESVKIEENSQLQRKGGLSYLFSSIAEIAARKFRRG